MFNLNLEVLNQHLILKQNNGLYDGNYFNYENDEIAIQREDDLNQEMLGDALWEDSAFPADGRSIYFDPLCPPKVLHMSLFMHG